MPHRSAKPAASRPPGPATEAPSGLAAGDVDDEHATQALGELMSRLARQPDFPSLSSALLGVRRVARSDSARVQQLAQALREDIGLAHRVLRQANAVHYRSVGGGEVETLERAIAVLGFQTVGQLSVSARVVQQVRDRGVGLSLRDAFLRALLAGVIGQVLQRRADEDVALLAMLRNLGRLMICLHWPEQAARIADAVRGHGWPLDEVERLTTRRLMGVDQDRLGQAVAERWGWPAGLRAAMRHVGEPARQAARTRQERLRCTAWLANELADALLFQPAERVPPALEALQRRFGPSTGLTGEVLQQALAQGRSQVDELCLQLELPLLPLPRWPLRPGAQHGLGDSVGESAQRPRQGPAAPAPQPLGAEGAMPQPPVLDADGVAAVSADAAVEAEAGANAPPAVDTGVLDSAVHSMTEALAAAQSATPLYQAVLQALLQGLGAQRAVLCLRRGRQGELAGSLGLGRAVMPGHPHFLVPPRDEADLFSLLCWRGVDSRIADTRDPLVARRLPHWWRQHLGARSVLVLPLCQAGEPVGMLYCDAPGAGAFDLDDAQWRLVRTLRNQALLAWRIGR